jgi:hypothetical protein
MLSSPCEFLASAFWDIAHRFRLFFHRAWSLAFFWLRKDSPHGGSKSTESENLLFSSCD